MMDPGQKILTPVKLNFLLLRLGQLSLVCIWVWKISRKNPKFLPFGSKNVNGPGQS